MKQPENQSKKYSALFHDIDEGRVKIPQFQRDFVWGKAKTAALVDSILKGFPIGTFIFWKTKDRLRHMRNVAGIDLKEPDAGDAIHYVLDGQQRITSLYAVRKGARITREGIEVDYKDISIDLSVDAGDDDEEEGIVLEAPRPGCDGISVHRLLNASVSELARDYANHIDKVSEYRERLNGYDFSVVVIDEYPIDVACEVFTRINTGGVELSLFEIMVAKTFDQDRFDLAERYADLISTDEAGKDLSSAGFETIPADTILQCVAAKVCGSIRRSDILRIARDDFIDAWEPTKDGIFAAVDYLRSHVGVTVSRILPYNVLLVPIAWFFCQKDGGGDVSKLQHKRLRQYFYWASLTNRFVSGVGTKIEADLGKMKDILEGHEPRYDAGELTIRPDDLRWTWFSVGNALCKAVVCLMSEKGPRRFNTNGKVVLDNSWLKSSSSRNYHHFFPRAYLRKLGDKSFANSIANIVLVDDYLNKRVINAKAPSVYMAAFGKENADLKTALRSHFIGPESKSGIRDDDYEVFLKHRSRRLAKALNAAMLQDGTRREGGHSRRIIVRRKA